MKFDEQDRVLDHALGFYLAFFLVIQPIQIFLSKPTRTERARQKGCIPRKSSVYICPEEENSRAEITL